MSFPMHYPARLFFARLTDEKGEAHYADVQLDFSVCSGVPCYAFAPLAAGHRVEAVWQVVGDGKWYAMTDEGARVNVPEDGRVVMGLFPDGGVALWHCDDDGVKLLGAGKAADVTDWFAEAARHDDYYRQWQEAYDREMGIPKRVEPLTDEVYGLFDGRMRHYAYRFLLLFETWDAERARWASGAPGENAAIPDKLKEQLADGTYDILPADTPQPYRMAARPEKLALGWSEGLAECFAFFWFDEARLRAVFDKFYGAHRDTRTDFIIRVDAAARKYELALFRYGLKEPVVIPEEAYQLLVFKNRFEDFRSPNYDQPRGAWIW